MIEEEAREDQSPYHPYCHGNTSQSTLIHNYQPNAEDHHDHRYANSLQIGQISDEGMMSVLLPVEATGQGW